MRIYCAFVLVLERPAPPVKLAKQDLVGALKQQIEIGKDAAVSVELTIEGCPDVSTCEHALRVLPALPGVEQVEVLQMGRARSKVALTTRTQTRALALALDDAASSGLSVVGYTDRAIRATWSAARGVRFLLLPGPLQSEPTQSARNTWRGRAFGGILATALSNLPFLKLPAGTDGVVDPVTPSQRASLAERAGVPPARVIVLKGHYRERSGGIHVEARLVSAVSGDGLLAGQRLCNAEKVEACVAALGDELAKGLPAAIVEKRRLFEGGKGGEGGEGGEGLGPIPSGLAQPDPPRPLEVIGVNVENVFPARLQTYAETPLGTLTLRNRSDHVVEHLTVTAQIRGFTPQPVDQIVARAEPNETVTVPIHIVLDATTLQRHQTPKPAVLELVLDYQIGELHVHQSSFQPLVIYGRNALTWTVPASIASFVTPQVESIRSLAWRGVSRVSDEERLSAPMAVFATLRQLGLRYVRDAVVPFGSEMLDSVQYPVETLSRGAGDCDDLTVLYASLLEAVGYPTLVLITPNHVLAAVHAGVPPQSGAQIWPDPSRWLEHDGELWVPVELTDLGHTFTQAWAEGAKSVALAQAKPGQLHIVDVRSAWRRYPPVSLATDEGPVAVELTDLAARFAAEINALRSARREHGRKRLTRIERQLASAQLDATQEDTLRNERGRLLVALGRVDEGRALGRVDEGRACLQRAAESSNRPHRALNNLGNLAVARGDLVSARVKYEKALKHEPSNARIHVNAAIAALSAGDEADFAEHLFACVEHNGAQLVEQLARARMEPDRVRGARAGGISAAKLRQLVAPFVPAKDSGATPPSDAPRAAEAGGIVPLKDYLYWL